MKKRLIVFAFFLLGLLVIITRLFQQENGVLYRGSVKENVLTAVLLIATWGTVIYITGKWFLKK